MAVFEAKGLFYKAGEGGGGSDPHNLGYYATLSDLQTAHPTAEAGDWAIVGATDTVWIWDDGTSAWVDSDQKGQVTSVNGQTGDVVIADEIPSQTGNAGKFLITDGTAVSWGNSSTPITINSGGISDLRTSTLGYGWLTLNEGQSNTDNYAEFMASTVTSSDIGEAGSTTYPCLIITGKRGNVYKTTIGRKNYLVKAIFTEQLVSVENNITSYSIKLPYHSGTMVVADYTGATEGQVLKLDSNGNATWANVATTPATMPTLAVADWALDSGTNKYKQTVNVTGVTATNVVYVAPFPVNADEYGQCNILAITQGAGTLTFQADTLPTNALGVNVVVLS